ncbi:MAG: nucleotidyl transferase AbiEii/AbiGii toxin family protein [Acidimicrobiia bacterium]
MNGLFSAANEVQGVLVAAGWRYCFIGGLAVQRWGEPRLTRDVDLTLLTGFGHEAPFIDLLVRRFDSRIPDAAEFALRNRVLLLKASEGIPVDVALGGLPFEERAVGRATAWPVPDGEPLLTCSAEDLVVHKVFAGRNRDWADVEGIIARQGATLDVTTIEAELVPLLELKGDESALPRLRAMLP